MGRAKRAKKQGKCREVHQPETEYVDPWYLVPSVVEGDGKVPGTGDQVGAASVGSTSLNWENLSEEDKAALYIKFDCEDNWKTVSPKEKGESLMSRIARWFSSRPSYFDTVTDLVQDVTKLECKLKDDEASAHEWLQEIEAARRELYVRVFRG